MSLELPAIRSALIRQEDTIIFALDRARPFKANAACYDRRARAVHPARLAKRFPRPHAAGDAMGVHGRVRRYTAPDEFPFFPEAVPPPELPVDLDAPALLGPCAVNLNAQIRAVYDGARAAGDLRGRRRRLPRLVGRRRRGVPAGDLEARALRRLRRRVQVPRAARGVRAADPGARRGGDHEAAHEHAGRGAHPAARASEGGDLRPGRPGRRRAGGREARRSSPTRARSRSTPRRSSRCTATTSSRSRRRSRCSTSCSASATR